MPTLPRVSTTEMEVTSIRLERELKDKLKQIAGSRGYQALIRDILWQYIEHASGEFQPQVSRDDIRASLQARAEREEQCALTGKTIHPQEEMLLGLTTQGTLVPLSAQSLSVAG